MLRINDLKPHPQASKKRKIVGRGPGSGHGGSSTRGMKGQKSRSGGGVRVGFEGGQMPLVRRLPKRGFTNIFRRDYAWVNLETLNDRFETGTEITPEILRERGLVDKNLPVKILGGGELTKSLVVKAHSFSVSAKEKIEKSGGQAVKI